MLDKTYAFDSEFSTFSINELCKTHWHYTQTEGHFNLLALETAWLIAN